MLALAVVLRLARAIVVRARPIYDRPQPDARRMGRGAYGRSTNRCALLPLTALGVNSNGKYSFFAHSGSRFP
jgi:hypothetical protein